MQVQQAMEAKSSEVPECVAAKEKLLRMAKARFLLTLLGLAATGTTVGAVVVFVSVGIYCTVVVKAGCVKAAFFFLFSRRRVGKMRNVRFATVLVLCAAF